MDKITESPAKVVHISTEKHSYGIFCYNELGDLFLNSDWGMFGFAWRSFGTDFQRFLAQTNSDYVAQKFENNFRTTTGKAMHKHVKEQITALIDAFIFHLKSLSVSE